MDAMADRLYTVEEVDALEGDYELDEGVLVPLLTNAKPLHGRCVSRMTTRLSIYVEQYGLGEVLAGDAGFVLKRNPDTLRGPDVAFVSRARVEAHGSLAEWMRGGPDLAVEVLSPGDRAGELQRKASQFLQAGTRLVWLLDPRRRRATIQRADGSREVLREAQMLDGEDVVPGFRCRLGDVF